MSENFILKSLTFEKYFKATAKIGGKKVIIAKRLKMTDIKISNLLTIFCETQLSLNFHMWKLSKVLAYIPTKVVIPTSQ